MRSKVGLLLLGLFCKTTQAASLDCNGCVEGLRILLDDHLSQGSVEGQTQVLKVIVKENNS